MPVCDVFPDLCLCQKGLCWHFYESWLFERVVEILIMYTTYTIYLIRLLHHGQFKQLVVIQIITVCQGDVLNYLNTFNTIQ